MSAAHSDTPDHRTPADRLAGVCTRERHRLTQRWRKARSDAERDRVAAAIEASAATADARLMARPPITLTPDLPVSERAEEVAEALAAHQVIVVCGETGSGKTTQLPKILMQAGLGARGLIGHTQPRRLAARSVATRIAEEVGVPLGELVGFQTRFDDAVSDATQLKLMTDGILLAETARDRYLNRYEAIIIDEAHERSLNIDFLLGYLKRLLPHRPDLKVVITSATIDPERFARFFDGAPVLSVEGRTYPVEVRYRPPEDTADQAEAVAGAVRELWQHGPGDILVFLAGERDIRDTERHLAKALAGGRFGTPELVPLYSRLTRSAQDRIFRPSRGRRIVMATNVAETSLTVPGIRYVIDTGLARISRYSTTARVQRLPIEAVSQASCNQRAGRCGRVAPGIAIRLFDADDYAARPAFTDPEIRRTNLASVLLTMADLKLGAIEDFPFVDPPERRYIRDGLRLLEQLQAMAEGRITPVGRKLARLPLDPRVGRMLVAAGELDVVPAVRVIAAGLTIQDPRERPADARQAADEAQAAFADKRSDFIGLLKLWDAYRERRRDGTSALRKWCRAHYLNFMRLREWEDLVRQLRQIGRDVGLPDATAREPLAETDPTALHRALLPGLLDHIGVVEEKGEYRGARNRRFRIFPGSALAGRPPRWIAAAELIDTSRLYAHSVAAVEPEWIEAAAAHLVTREHHDPHWEKKRGQVVARERVSLFGLPLSNDRRVDFGRIDPAAARTIFINDGLVPGEVTDKRRRLPAFLEHNQRVVAEIEQREARFRRRDLLVDDLTQAAFYDECLPSEVRDRASLQRWLQRHDDAVLRFDEESLLRHAGVDLPEDDFPETLRIGATPVALAYRFEPGRDDDGVTARVPLALLNQVTAEHAGWPVPGLLEEKVREYLKALPKSLRRHVVPVPDFARAAAERMNAGDGRFEDVLADAINRMAGLDLTPEVWDGVSVSPHLRLRVAVIDDDGEMVDADRDIDALRRRLGQRAREAVRAMPDTGWERQGITTWDIGDLPQTVTLEHAGVQLTATPTLIDRGNSADLQLIDEPERAARLHRGGVIRLLHHATREQCRFIVRSADGLTTLSALPLPEAPDTALVDPNVLSALQASDRPLLVADLLYALIAGRMGDDAPREAAAFEALAERVRPAMAGDANALWGALRPALETWRTVRKRIAKNVPLAWMDAVGDIRAQLDHLIHAGCISHTPDPKHLNRYLQAIEQRLDKLDSESVERDRERMQQVQPYWQAYLDRAARRRTADPALCDYRWMVEEFRVQVFAQPLGTAIKVSPQRLDRALAGLR